MLNSTTSICLVKNFTNYISLSFSIILMICCVFGLTTNILSVYIFLQKRFRRLSINTYLAAISVADLIQLSVDIPVFAIGPFFSYYCKWEIVDYFYNISAIYLYPFVMITHSCSIWLLTAVSYERWVAVCRPFRAATYCKRKRAICIITVICILSVAYNGVRFSEFELVDNSTSVASTPLNADPRYQLWYNVFSHIFLNYLIPLIVMAILNTIITIELRRSTTRRLAMSATQRENQTTAKMLLFIIIRFVICYSPSFILETIQSFYPMFLFCFWGYVFGELSNILLIVNPASNFLFYFTFSSLYRQTALSIFQRQATVARQSDKDRLFSLIGTSPSVINSRFSIHQKTSVHSKKSKKSIVKNVPLCRNKMMKAFPRGESDYGSLSQITGASLSTRNESLLTSTSRSFRSWSTAVSIRSWSLKTRSTRSGTIGTMPSRAGLNEIRSTRSGSTGSRPSISLSTRTQSTRSGSTGVGTSRTSSTRIGSSRSGSSRNANRSSSGRIRKSPPPINSFLTVHPFQSMKRSSVSQIDEESNSCIIEVEILAEDRATNSLSHTSHEQIQQSMSSITHLHHDPFEVVDV